MNNILTIVAKAADEFPIVWNFEFESIDDESFGTYFPAAKTVKDELGFLSKDDIMRELIKAAIKDYAETEEGQRFAKDQGFDLNWSDSVFSVFKWEDAILIMPSKVWEKYGIKQIFCNPITFVNLDNY